MSDFRRTLQTATDADSIAVLLRRAAERAIGFGDRARLEALAQRYVDYAAALRETAADDVAPPTEEQQALL